MAAPPPPPPIAVDGRACDGGVTVSRMSFFCHVTSLASDSPTPGPERSVNSPLDSRVMPPHAGPAAIQAADASTHTSKAVRLPFTYLQCNVRELAWCGAVLRRRGAAAMAAAAMAAAAMAAAAMAAAARVAAAWEAAAMAAAMMAAAAMAAAAWAAAAMAAVVWVAAAWEAAAWAAEAREAGVLDNPPRSRDCT